MTRTEKYEQAITLDESKQIEDLLSAWYDWQIQQSEIEIELHDYRPDDHTCRSYITPSDVDERRESARHWADNHQSEQVQLCIDMLPAEHRAAISTSMRNKACGYGIWSSGRAGDLHATYQSAKLRLFPMLIARRLVKREAQGSTMLLRPRADLTADEIEEMRMLFSNRFSGQPLAKKVL